MYVLQSITDRDLGGAGVSRVQEGTYEPVRAQLIVSKSEHGRHGKKEILLNIPSGKFACENEAELVERDPKLKNPGACICWR
jgi:hypothetical protein